jgi:hypothetical protein
MCIKPVVEAAVACFACRNFICKDCFEASNACGILCGPSLQSNQYERKKRYQQFQREVERVFDPLDDWTKWAENPEKQHREIGMAAFLGGRVLWLCASYKCCAFRQWAMEEGGLKFDLKKQVKNEERNLKLAVLDVQECQVCSSREQADHMLLCDGCEKGFHTFCLNPPLTAVPRGDWFCPKCQVVQRCGGTNQRQEKKRTVDSSKAKLPQKRQRMKEVSTRKKSRIPNRSKDKVLIVVFRSILCSMA